MMVNGSTVTPSPWKVEQGDVTETVKFFTNYLGFEIVALYDPYLNAIRFGGNSGL